MRWICGRVCAEWHGVCGGSDEWNMRVLSFQDGGRISGDAEHPGESEMARLWDILGVCRDELGVGVCVYLHSSGEEMDVWDGTAVWWAGEDGGKIAEEVERGRRTRGEDGIMSLTLMRRGHDREVDGGLRIRALE